MNNEALDTQPETTPALVTRLRAFTTCRVQFNFGGTDYVALRNVHCKWEMYRAAAGIETFLGYAEGATAAELDRLQAKSPNFSVIFDRAEPRIIGSNLGRQPVIVRPS